MANEHIEISPSATRMSGELRRLIRQVQTTVDETRALKLTIDQIGANADVAIGLGITADEAGRVKSLLTNAYVVLTGADVAYFLSRLG
jgi:hypothetical protein